MKKPENLIFEGGGVKGIAYAGALSVLESAKLLTDLKRVGGTSAGAILALLVALDYSAAEISELSLSINFLQFEDGNIFTDVPRFFEYYGYFQGNIIKQFLENLIEKKLGNKQATFQDLHHFIATHPRCKDLYIVAANLSCQEVAVFSYESNAYCNVPLAEAVRASMSIPGVFQPIQIKNPIHRWTEYMVDGGFYRNYYLDLFDEKRYLDPKLFEKQSTTDTPYFNPRTLGLRLDDTFEYTEYDEHEPVHRDLNNFWTFWCNAIDGFMNQQKTYHRTPADVHRSIACDSGDVATTDFSISIEKRLQLIKNGAFAAQTFLNQQGIEVPTPSFTLPTGVEKAQNPATSFKVLKNSDNTPEVDTVKLHAYSQHLTFGSEMRNNEVIKTPSDPDHQTNETKGSDSKSFCVLS